MIFWTRNCMIVTHIAICASNAPNALAATVKPSAGSSRNTARKANMMKEEQLNGDWLVDAAAKVKSSAIMFTVYAPAAWSPGNGRGGNLPLWMALRIREH
jgi:hypothetical protein